MSRHTLLWNLMAKRYAAQPIRDTASYEKKLAITRKYLTPESEVFEFGCGTGSTALLHAPYVKHIDATDFSEKMIEIAKDKQKLQNVNNIDFNVADIRTMSVSSAKYDVILGLNIVHLMEDKPPVLAKVHTMLKPGGYFISSTVCFVTIPGPMRLMLTVMSFLGLFPKLKPYLEDDFLRDIKQAGFEVAEQWKPEGEFTVVFLVARKSV